MTGRGIDQVLPYPSEPTLHESYVKNAKAYVELAEQVNGPIPKIVDFEYVWGDALPELYRREPDVRIINLETSITKISGYWKHKEVHYRMNPANIPFLTAAKVDCSSLANNHILDYGQAGLTETLTSLKKEGINSCGAGANIAKAAAPAVLNVPSRGRILVFAFSALDSGVPSAWAASKTQPGLNLLEDYSQKTLEFVRAAVSAKSAGDLTVFSVHWGGNWGYSVPAEHRTFAHRLIDEAGVDVVFGHSSHHAKGIEVYADKLILYGCGDFINDYEGIGGYEEFRGDLALMYFVDVYPQTGKLVALKMTPMQIRKFRLNRVSAPDLEWLQKTLSHEGKRLGTSVELNSEGDLELFLG